MGLTLGWLQSVGDQADGVRCALRVPRASRPSAFYLRAQRTPST